MLGVYRTAPVGGRFEPPAQCRWMQTSPSRQRPLLGDPVGVGVGVGVGLAVGVGGRVVGAGGRTTTEPPPGVGVGAPPGAWPGTLAAAPGDAAPDVLTPGALVADCAVVGADG